MHSMTVRDSRQLGNAVKRARRLRKWSQHILAEKAGVSQVTISLLESGERDARLDTVTQVLAALRLELVVQERTQDPIGEPG
jgi:HTH-type transcriptional regulator / antitoxin HipB